MSFTYEGEQSGANERTEGARSSNGFQNSVGGWTDENHLSGSHINQENPTLSGLNCLDTQSSGSTFLLKQGLPS